MIEKVKEYWDKRPCNIRHSNKEVGTIEYFNAVEYKKYYVEPHIRDFADFRKWHGKRVLEIGCGLGTESVNFARWLALVTAVDLSEKSLEIAEKRAEVFKLQNKIKFYQGNAEELDKIVPIETYDLIWSFGVIHHSPDPSKIIRNIKKYMGPDSELRLMVYNKFSWKVFWIILLYGKGAFWKADKLIAQHSEAQMGCPITYTYTKKSIQNLLQDFEIKCCFIDHIFPYKVKDYIKHQYKKVWYFRYMPFKFFKWLEGVIGWHMCVTAKLK